MALKITLIVAVCLAGVFAHRPARGPYKTPISEPAEEIGHEFEEAVNEMDGIPETVMHAYVHSKDPNVIIECFRQESENYVKLGQKISGMIDDATNELAQELQENFDKYAQRAEEPLRIIGETMRTLPQKMWEHIKEKEFSKALEVMRESRQIVEENSRELGEIIRDMAEEAPKTAERAEELAREIRETARRGCKEITLAFRQCVEEGGPAKTEA